jgi:hypothetical protein
MFCSVSDFPSLRNPPKNAIHQKIAKKTGIETVFDFFAKAFGGWWALGFGLLAAQAFISGYWRPTDGRFGDFWGILRLKNR